jgi:hypothetical protein
MDEQLNIQQYWRRGGGTSLHHAVRITPNVNMQAVANWCGGTVVTWNGRPAVRVPTLNGAVTYATVSDVVVRGSSGKFSAYNGWHFHEQFRAVEASHG